MYKIRLRKSTENDRDFVNKLTRSTMRAYVESTWHRIEDVENYYFINRFNQLTTLIIQCNNEDIGRLTVTYSNDRVILDDIHIVKPFQGKGIGGKLIRQIIREAKKRQQPVELILLKTNPVKQLYERIGFHIYKQDVNRYYMRKTY